ncbi:MAG: FliA/WhiG family RNA polymerase sigma factor [Deltaproteobacteria bacterium]|nr:FliA/WhiG family RNA polymerase sigma factor [Deltaproteobacteria bacterium]
MLQAIVATEETKVSVGLQPQVAKRAKAKTGGKKQREELVEAFLPLVRLIAERIYRRLPVGTDLESLVQAGVMGLLEAFDRYNPERGTFPTYARYRIRGEIMEYLRSLDWASRSLRAWGRKTAAARDRLLGWLGREASAEEIATELGISLKHYYRVDQKLNEAMLLSLDDVSLASEEKWKKVQEEFCRHSFQDPLSFLEDKNLIEKLTIAVEVLSERERLVVTLYYHEELTLREIGEVLNLSEGRISQIHRQAVSHLRQALSGNQEENCNSGSFRYPQPQLRP